MLIAEELEADWSTIRVEARRLIRHITIPNGSDQARAAAAVS